jgi:hypothetical protein
VSIQQELDELVSTLRRERDELHVQLHLARADARDEWNELEKKWERFQSKSATVATAAGAAAGDIGAALRILGDELRAGYRRVRESIKSA